MAPALAADDGPLLCPPSTWFCGKYITNRGADIKLALQEHISLALGGVALGLVLSFGLALLARRSQVLRNVILGGSTLLYTIPSLALLAILVPLIGLSKSQYAVLFGIAIYSLVVLVRAFVTGLAGVPDEVTEAARGMGFGTVRMLLRVELPLALPTIMAGLRVATVSGIALVTLGVVVDHGGLGNLLDEATTHGYKFEALTASVLCVVLAVVADVVLLLMQKLITPWRRGRAAR
ncbi:MAG: ABC transporter permease [Mycobacteriales bacterium]